jgi:hypothetical protein
MAFSHDLPPHARLFPLQKNSKRPAIKDWPRLATADPGTLDKWFGDTFKGHNVAVATGQGLMVLDVDTKNGRGGQESLDLLDAMGLPPSYRVKTPSGGVHIYLKADEPISNSVDALEGFPGIDVRGENGYVAAPPSLIDGSPYELLTPVNALADAPEWIVELCRRKRHKKADTDQPVVELDTDEAKRRATSYLENHAPQAISGEAGNDTTFKVAARLRDYGLSEPIALELLADHWNSLNEPPWDYEDLERIVGNAFRYASAEWGGASGLRDFEPYEILEPVKKERGKAISLAEASERAYTVKVDYLIEDIINRNSMNIVYGPSGSGKSFLALDLAFHIAAGLPWNGHETKKGTVFYLATEGGVGIYKRCAALMKHYNIEGPIPLYIWNSPVDLLRSKKDCQAVIEEARRVEKETGEPLQFLIIDTVARAMAGGDENSSTDMGTFVKHVDHIQEATACAVGLIHHTGKDTTRGARGWSGLRAATDTEIEILDNTIRITKQRDMEFIEDIRFKLEKVVLIPDELDSCVIRVLLASEFNVTLTPMAEKVLAVFEKLYEASGELPVDNSEWLNNSRQMLGISQSSFDRAKTELEDCCQIRKVRKGRTIQWVRGTLVKP